MDGLEIKSEADLERVFRERDWQSYAVELANLTVEADVAQVERGIQAVVAGRQMDLSAQFSCVNAECQIAQADRLLMRAWHYFDSIIVEGLGPRRFLALEKHQSHDETSERLRNHALVLLHLRGVGADPYLVFQEKPHGFCESHFQTHAKEVGLSAAADPDVAGAIIKAIAAEVRIEHFAEQDNRVLYAYTHPLLDMAYIHSVVKGAEPETATEWAKRTFVAHCVGEIGDVALAREQKLPLMSTADKVVDLSRGAPLSESLASEGDVGLAISVPILQGLTPGDLLHLREEHFDEFTRFRAAMVAAIREQRARVGEDKDPGEVAQAVRQEYLEPLPCGAKRPLAGFPARNESKDCPEHDDCRSFSSDRPYC